MAQTKPKAGQFYGVSDNGTDGQFLKTDGTGGMSWDSPITNPTITSIDYPGSATAADPAGGESVIINGTLFASGVTCTVGGTSAVTAFNSATQITITTPAKAAGQYTVEVTNPDGGTASQVNFIQYSGVPVWSTASGNIGSVQSGSTASFQVTATEGSDTIEYAVTTGTLPSGLSLNTNTGAITGTAGYVSASTTTTFSITATDDENQTSSARSFNITVTPDLPSNYFNTSIYNGSGASQSITTGFAPDFTWIKSRSNGTWHCVADTVRGNLSRIFPNDAYQQVTNNNGFLSFDSNGFNLDGQGGGGDVNTSGRTYVAWSLKAGGAAVANNDGTQTTQVSANNTLGFSIVSYSTNNDASKTFGHGLDAAPELIITKATNAAVNWAVYNSTIGKTKFLELNNNSSQWSANSNDYYNTTTGVNSTVFGYSYSGTTYDFISYCFTSKTGFSKVGSYTGNASTNGPMVQTGFQPAFVMIKKTSANDDWFMFDDKRSPTNSRQKYILANSSNAEADYGNPFLNIYANGFQPVTTSGAINSGDYIYLAFAADPSTTTPSLANSFATEIYAGNGSSQSITGTGFKPDLIWFKNRTGAYPYQIYNSIRGVDKFLNCGVATTVGSYTGTGAEFNDSGYDLMSFDSNGFTLGASAFGSVNESGFNNVAWCWKAGGTPSINTDGTITSLVSANQAAGFSISEYNHTTTSGTFSVGHGLGAAPELVFFKCLVTSNSSWIVYYAPDETKLLVLNANGAASPVTSGSSASYWSTSPSSSVFNFGNAWATNYSYYAGPSIMYSFKSITGYSKVGTYTGNGTLGHSISVGFAPGFVMLKMISSSGDWYMFDNKRTTGVYSDQLIANSLATEATGTYVDLTSTGFDLNTTLSSINNNGETFIYLAIKEN